jgi:hypothetical protein
VEIPITAAPDHRFDTGTRWVNRLFAGLVVYCAVGATFMLTGILGPVITHYVGLMWCLPAGAVASVMAAITGRRAPPGNLRRAWLSLAIALGLYIAGECIGVTRWMHNPPIDPFPGPGDFLYCGFYLALPTAAIFLIRAAAVRVPWVQLSMDATIFAVGFGAFFWFLVLHPAAPRGLRPPRGCGGHPAGWGRRGRRLLCGADSGPDPAPAEGRRAGHPRLHDPGLARAALAGPDD